MIIKIAGYTFAPEELGFERMEAGGKTYYDVTKVLVDCGPKSVEFWKIAEYLRSGMKPKAAMKQAANDMMTRKKILENLQKE